MIYELSFHYQNCRECADRSECEQCREQLEEEIYRAEGVDGVAVDMRKWHISIETDSLGSEELREILEESGVSAESST